MSDTITIEELLEDENATPTSLIPKMGEFPVSNSAFYKQLIITDVASGSVEGNELNEPINPFSAETFGDLPPATGVLLTFEQGWYQRGLALGELRKSLTLAPGEVTRVAVVDWQRQTRSSETASRDDTDSLTQQTNEETGTQQVQRLTEEQARAGNSFNAGSSTQKEASARGGGLFFSAGGSVSNNSFLGFSASSSTGSRDVASSAAKQIQRRTEQAAQSTRSTRATQVREVSEAESQSTTTRVVANYNHAHALTIEYFEVLQSYRLTTKVVRADRCVFIPMHPLEFNEAGMQGAEDATIELLREVLRDLSAYELDEMVGNYQSTAPLLVDAIEKLQDKLEDLHAEEVRVDDNLAKAQSSRENARNALEQSRMLWQRALADLRSASAFETPELLVNMIKLQNEFLKKQNEDFSASAVYQTTKTALDLSKEALMTARRAVKAELSDKQNALQESGRMFGILQKNRVLLNQQMWMRIDDHVWHRKLRGKKFPHGEYEGQELGGLVDPKPVGFFGNYLAFTWDFPREAAEQAAAYEASFEDRSSTTATVALPTEGVFAEAVLGQANSAEKIDITRFWNWQDSPIPILPPSMSPVDSGSRSRTVGTPAPLDFGEAIIKLRELGVDPTDVSDSALVAALQNSIGSNDAALLGAAATAGITASNNASDGAGRAGQQAIDAMKNSQEFVVGLANSEAGKIATQAVAAGATGGVSSVGGLLNAASKANKVASLASKKTNTTPT